MGGGSAPAPAAAPTQTTVQNTNIPDYAQPYVSNMLNATQSQLFNTDSSGNITGFAPYVPYSNNPANYVAGFSPLQQQAQSSAANLQMPGQYNAATGIAGAAGLGSLGIAGQASQAGQNLQNTLTSPGAMAQYMNPYLQNTLAPAEQLLNQQYGIAGTQMAGQATGQGAFGGTRNALQQGLNQQNQMLAQNQLVGNAYNQAYQNAQQQAMNVANTGLAGQQAALQGMGQANTAAGNLAGIGGQQLSAQQGIIGTQAQQGAAQQANQQQIINQAIQNYATAQQYPLLELGTMSNMLRGLPMQSQTTQIYQAQPTTAQQAIGLGGTAAALAAATGGGSAAPGGIRKGGQIKEKKMASGGIADVPGFKYGAIINDPKLENDARMLGASPAQPGQPSPLQQRIQDPQLNQNERNIFQGVQQDQDRLRQVPGAAQALQQAGQMPQMPQPQMNPQVMQQARLSGLGAAGGPAFNSQQFAGGGIIAFNGEDDDQLVDETHFGVPTEEQGLTMPPKSLSTKAPKKTQTPTTLDKQNLNSPQTPQDFISARQSAMKSLGFDQGPTEAEKAYVESQKAAASKDVLNRNLWLAAAQGFAKMGSTAAPGGILQAFNIGAQAALPSIEKAYDANEAAKVAAAKTESDMSEAQRKFAEGDVDGGFKDYDSALRNKTELDVARIHANAAGQSAAIESKAIQDLMNTQGISYGEAYKQVKGLDARDATARMTAMYHADSILNQDTKYMALKMSKKPEDQQAARAMREGMIQDYMQALGPQGTGPQNAAKNTGTANTAGAPVTTKAEYDKLPSGAHYVAPDGTVRVKG